jgi:hypothetical protein
LIFLVPACISISCSGCRVSTGHEVFPEWGPFITNTNNNSTVIGWKTLWPGSAIIRFTEEKYFRTYGTYDRYLIEGNDTLHHVTLNDLQPATAYHYRIWFVANNQNIQGKPAPNEIEALCASSDATADHSFRTLGDEAFTFIVYGDTRAQPPFFTEMERHRLVADRIAGEKDANFIINTGDLVYNAADEGDWTDFFSAGRAMLADKTYYPVQGNHDKNAKYENVFGLPAYYSFQCGRTRFVALDSNDDANYPAQGSWLQNELPDDHEWKFVYYHYPAFTSEANHWGGWENIRDSWHGILVKQNVTAIFNGHVHAYERYIENGVNYIVVATGGAPTYHLAEKKIDGYQASLEDTLGYLRVKVNQEQVVMEFIMVARVSVDGNSLEMYPPNTIFDTVEIQRTIEAPANGSPSVIVK